jgi:cell division protein DivIC
MMNIKEYIKENWHIVKNKYFISAFVFILWVSFFDDNNLLERRQLIKEKKQLIQDKKYYLDKIAEDKGKLEKLDDNQYLEKFAREQYFMKKPGEDVYVVVKE